jgi:hypothetical protein
MGGWMLGGKASMVGVECLARCTFALAPAC